MVTLRVYGRPDDTRTAAPLHEPHQGTQHQARAGGAPLAMAPGVPLPPVCQIIAGTSRYRHEKVAQDKITRNRERDARNQALLQAAGWNVIVIWECQLSAKNRVQTLRELDIILSRIILAQNGSRLQPQSYSMGLEDEETATAAEATTPYGNTK